MGGEDLGETAPARILVEQRDGTLAPLDSGRLAEELLTALERAEHTDPMLCQEVLELVRLASASGLERRRAQGETQPYLERGALGDLVEQALVQMGHAPLAKAYILMRAQRHRARAAMNIASGSRSAEAGGHEPVVRDGSGVAPWDLARIAAALVREAELPQEIAKEVARRVEQRVFDAGLRRLTSSLVRAFVDNELGAMGLEEALQRQRPVGIPRHDLRQWIRTGDRQDSGPLGPQAISLLERLGAEVMRRFTEEDVLDADAVEWHQSGVGHLDSLHAPHKPLVLGVPCELLLRGSPSSQTPLQLLPRLGPLLGRTVQGLVLEDLEAALTSVGRGGRAAAHVRDFLLAAGALATSHGKEFEICNPGGRGGRWSAVLLAAAWENHKAGQASPRLWLDGAEMRAAQERDPDLREAIEELLGVGRLVGIWHGGTDRYAGPGLRRKGRERGALACGGALNLNLPRLARQAGPWREERFLEAIVERIRDGVRLLSRLARFQRGREEFEGLLRPRVSYVLAPIGLYQALQILGDGEIRADQGARILGLMAEAVSRFGHDENLSVHLDGAFGHGAARRFARLDRDMVGTLQARLFSDLPVPEGESTVSYSVGFLPTPTRNLPQPGGMQSTAAYLARLLIGVRAGALHTPFGSKMGPVGGESSLLGNHLDLWNRFEALRTEHLSASPIAPVPAPETQAPVSLFDSPG